MAQFEVETVAIDALQPHPRNYRAHPEEQVEAIAASLEQFGQYRPIVVSSDGYILAGEGVWRGRQKAGCADIDAVRMPFAHDDPRAEKLLVADNELSRLAEDDDARLAGLLRGIADSDLGLVGTGYDETALQALLGDLTEAEFGGTEEAQNLEHLAGKWLIACVVDEATKRSLDDRIAAERQPGETPNETLARLVVAEVVKKA